MIFFLNSVERKVGKLSFTKLKLWKIKLSLPTWLGSLYLRFFELNKNQLFDGLAHIFSLALETKLVKSNNNFVGRISYYNTQEKKT